jgi:hypothetical protein
MDSYNSMSQNDYNKYIFTELTLLGDPEMPLWKENPSWFVVTHPTEIQVGYSSFTVHVENSTGDNIENAYICLWKGDEVYLTNYTDSSGNVTFNPSPSTDGNMTVTVTKQDYIPYEGNVITSNEPPSPPVINGPRSGKPNKVYTFTFISIDPDGDQVSYYINWGDGSVTDWTSYQASGSPGYIENHSWKPKGTYTISTKAEDVYGAKSDLTTLEITIPRNKVLLISKPILLWLLERFPILRYQTRR